MAQNISLLSNKVARRILVSFILAAIIPIGILGTLSFQQVQQQLQVQSDKTLRKNCKDFALGLVERLTLFEKSLRLTALNVTPTKQQFSRLQLSSTPDVEEVFIDLVLISLIPSKNLPVPTDFQSVPTLSGLDVEALNAGKALIKFVPHENGNQRIWMAIKLDHHHESGILLAELAPDLVWERDSFDANSLWVFDDAQHLLFASEPAILLPVEIINNLKDANGGAISWKNNAIAYVGAFWKIPIKSIFAAPEIIIIQSQPKAYAFAAIKQFSSIYPPVIALTVLIVVFLSTRLISKYLTPLERLKTATQRIANGDLTTHVNIESNDEFEALGESFNEMTRRLHSQFDILSTMAEIDRHILSALNANEIIEIALNRLPAILFCDLIAIAKLDPDTSLISNICTKQIGEEIKCLSDSIKLSQQDLTALLNANTNVVEIVDENSAMTSYCSLLNASGNWQYLFVPVLVNDALTSIITLGYQAPKQIPEEAKSIARNFADRIAVALSNAAWEEKLYQQAHYDSLTGLPNRLVLNDRLAQEFARTKRDGTQLAVFFIDLDRFKNINDSLGHTAGDELLTQVSQILSRSVRATDLVVRNGGDEFIIVISDLHENENPTILIRAVAEKILASLKQTLTVAGHQVTFTASIGIALFPQDADNARDLLKNADAAMYHAKNEGRANFRFYSPELNSTALENIKLEQALRDAINNGEFQVHYQPKVNMNRQIVGAEALLRWQNTELGMISPAKFIPLAEQTGLIIEIGQWVLEQTCLLINNCYAHGVEPVSVSVNLCGIEFKQPDLVAKVAAILTKTGVDPKFIELELTESVAIGNIKTCVKQMHALKDLGISLSMDDFGTGFSSLSYLKELPLDVIKIDQSFVRQLGTEDSSQAIVSAILTLANGLNMATVAEGVEKEAQLELLKEYDCHTFQGFLFSRAVPGDDFLKLLANNSN